MKICNRCVMPSTKPDLNFDESGVCDACQSQDSKNNNIDWKAREKDFLNLVRKHKKNPDYDCIIGVSGGKDSTVQVLKALELGLNPSQKTGRLGSVDQAQIK